MKSGFTLIEILMAIAGAGVVVVAATAFLFSVLAQKDQAVGGALIADQAEMMEMLVGAAVRSGKNLTVDEGGKRLMIANETECLTLVWDEQLRSLNYARSTEVNCAPPVTANDRLTSEKAKVENLNWQIVNSDNASRTVKAEVTMAVYKPLWSGSQIFNFTWVNLIDE